MLQINKGLKRRLKMLTKRYLILVGWSKRLITTQKIWRLKTRSTRTVTGLVTAIVLNTKATVIEK